MTRRHTKIYRTKNDWLRNCVIADNGCWEWVAHRNLDGYGVLLDTETKKNTGAHRFAYRLFKGDIEAGKEIRHLCFNPCCVNPDHLTTGTHLENIKDSVDAGRLTCAHMKRPKTASEKEKISIALKSYAAKLRTAGVPRVLKRKIAIEEVPVIRSRCASGESTKAIADEFNVDRSAINKLVSKRTWANV